jgi:hypothetical protein
MTEAPDYPVELIRTVLTPEDTIIRATVCIARHPCLLYPSYANCQIFEIGDWVLKPFLRADRVKQAEKAAGWSCETPYRKRVANPGLRKSTDMYVQSSESRNTQYDCLWFAPGAKDNNY